MSLRHYILTAATAASMSLIVCALALPGTAAEEKAAKDAKDAKTAKAGTKDDAKKGEDAPKAEPVKISYLEVPEAVRKAAMSETGNNRVFNKIKTDDGIDAFLITYRQYGRSMEMTVAMDGNIIKKDDVTPVVPEPKKEAPKAEPEPKTPAKTVVKAVTKPTTKPAVKTEPKTETVAKVDVKGGVSFSKQIVPILARACYSCHDVNKRKADLDLKTSHNTVMDSVKAGNPDNSLLYNSLLGAKGIQKMPKGGKGLAPDEIAAVRAWIAAGAKDN